MGDLVKAWLPWEDPERVLGGVPDGVSAQDGPDGAEFYVPPYMGAVDLPAVFAAMPSLKVVQLQTAGYEAVLPHLPEGVTLCNARGVHDASTAELAVGL